MKKLLVLLFMILALVFIVKMTEAQTAPTETVTINKSDLTPAQIAKITAEEQMAKIETYGKWVGVGNEIGVAIKEGLTAVVDVSERFSNTKVGEFTMYLIAWKVIGKDLVRIVLGILFIIFITVIIFKSLRRMYPRRIALKTNGWKFWLPREYQLIKPETYDGYEFVKVLHIIMLAAAFGLTYAIMFG